MVHPPVRPPYRCTAAWVLPVAAPPIADGALLVDADGRIAAVGPDAAVPAPSGVPALPLGAAALLPGLVNAHAHPELAAYRGLLEDLPFLHWLRRLMLAREAVAPTPEEYEACALWSCAEALAAGITTIGATEDSGAALPALRAAGMRGIVYREVFGPDPGAATGALLALAAKVRLMRRHESDLVRVGISPHAPYTVSDALYQGAARLALDERLPVACHAAEAELETQLVRAGAGSFAEGLRRRGIATPPRARSTIALLQSTGILETRPLLIHAVQVDAEDIAAITASGAAVAHCPVANARLGHGVAPVPELQQAGVVVALGTDSVGSNNRLDLLEEARAAQLCQRGRLRRPDALPAERLLRMVTLDGARALGLDDRVGSLVPGKDADLCAVALDRVHTTPTGDVTAALFHAARGSDVVLAAVRGRILYRAGRWSTLDPAELAPRIQTLAARLAAAIAAAPARQADA
jgi:cytosine/adenosine deaminase-related metal-dependent hydrolase